jgi:hypothetical protein
MTTTLWVSVAVVLALSLTFALRRVRRRKRGLLAVTEVTRLIEYSVGVGPRPPLFTKSRTKP